MDINSPSGATVARVSSGVIYTASNSTLGYVKGSRVDRSNGSTLGYIENGYIMNASRSTIGRYDSSSLRSGSGSTRFYLKDREVTDSSNRTVFRLGGHLSDYFHEVIAYVVFFSGLW